MELKYYTPTIEDFHKGFEFEWLHNEFVKETFAITTDDDLEIIDDEIREGKIRVKHLDIQDIESLGWEISKIQRNPKTACFEKSDSAFRFVLEIDINSVKIDAYLDFKIPMFIGSVKNKSELKKLMQMLNLV